MYPLGRPIRALLRNPPSSANSVAVPRSRESGHAGKMTLPCSRTSKPATLNKLCFSAPPLWASLGVLAYHWLPGGLPLSYQTV